MRVDRRVALGLLLAGIIAIVLIIQTSESDGKRSGSVPPTLPEGRDPDNLSQVKRRLRELRELFREAEVGVGDIERLDSTFSTKCFPMDLAEPGVSVEYRSTGSIPLQLAEFKANLEALGFKSDDDELAQISEVLPTYILERDERGWTAGVLLVKNGQDTLVMSGSIRPDPCK